MKFIGWSLLLHFIVIQINAKDVFSYHKEDSLVFQNYQRLFSGKRDLPFSDMFLQIAESFIGKPYVSATLEQANNESLIINLREFDCFTFVENCIALTQTLKSNEPIFTKYCHFLQQLRYRNGQIDGYASRLHYTSDWIYENAKKGVFNNITKDLGGSIIDKKINFMTTHANLYKHLLNDKTNLDALKVVEGFISDRKAYVVINKKNIKGLERTLRSGDIVVFASCASGLDYSHIGIVINRNGSLKFIHASSREGKIVIDSKNLIDYTMSNKSCAGLSILRFY